MGTTKIQERAVVSDASATDLQLPTFASLTAVVRLKVGGEEVACCW